MSNLTICYKLSFFSRKPYKLTVAVRKRNKKYIKYTNLDDDEFIVCQLVKLGYGSYPELMALDTPEFLNRVEFADISSDIEAHMYEEAKSGRSG